MQTEATLLTLMNSEMCTEPGCETQAFYAVSVGTGPFEVKCRDHMPEGSLAAYWTQRLMLAAQDGNERKVRSFLHLVEAEARREGYERCALIAEVQAQGARRYANRDTAQGAEEMAKQIIHCIRRALE